MVNQCKVFSRILLETDDVAVLMVAIPDSSQTVVTFTPRLLKPMPGPVTGSEGFGRDLFIKEGISCIHVVPKWNHWWQSADMPLALDAIQRHLPCDQEIWTYGASMGGCGALMFAKQLGATGVLAICPQASVDLSRASFEPRWMEDRKRLHTCDDSWLEEPFRGNVWLLFDPRYKLDKQHIDILFRSGWHARQVSVGFGEHSVMGMLKECGMLSSTVRSIFNGTFQQRLFQSDLRHNRHRSPVVFSGVANELLRRGKTHLACRFSGLAIEKLAAMKKSGLQLDVATTTLITHNHSLNLVKARNRILAAEFLQELRDHPLVPGDYDWHLLQLAFICGDRAEAERLFIRRSIKNKLTGHWQKALEGCVRNGFLNSAQLENIYEPTKINAKEIEFLAGPSHVVRMQWHIRDGILPISLSQDQLIGIGGAPVWSKSLFERTFCAAGDAKRIALIVPDFRLGNGIELDSKARGGPVLRDGFVGITAAALTTENDQRMLERSMAALHLWHERFGGRVRYIFWSLFGRQVHDRLAGKYINGGRYHHPVFNYDEITAALPELDIIDLSPLLRRPMHDVRRLFIDTSSHPSQVGYLMLKGLLFDGLDATAAYERAVATVEADLVALAHKIRERVGKTVLVTGRSVWLDVLIQILGATGAEKLAEAGLVLVPIDRGIGQVAPAEILANYPLANCQAVVISAGGADLSQLLDPIFGTAVGFWSCRPIIDWESSTEAAIRSRGETPRFTRVAAQSPGNPNAILVDLPAHAVEQGPLGMPSWSGIVTVLEKLTETLSMEPSWRTVGDVLLTRNNVAFLIGGNHAVLKFATGELSPSSESLSAFRNNIASRVTQARSAGSAYLHVIFPDKQSVFSDEFPFQPVHRLGDAYMGQIESDLRSNVLWPADELKLQQERPFLPLDTHMTDHGSLAVLKMMLRSIGMSAESALERIESRIVRFQRWQGDLGSKIDPPLFQEGTLLDPDWPQKQFKSPGGFNDGMVDIILNPIAHSDKTVLLFGDSFFRMMLKHLSAVFSRVICLRTRFLHSEMVTLVQPDVIFTGNAERYLSNVTPDTEAHAFALYPHLRGTENLRMDDGFLAAWAAVTAPDSKQSKKFMVQCGFPPY